MSNLQEERQIARRRLEAIELSLSAVLRQAAEQGKGPFAVVAAVYTTGVDFMYPEWTNASEEEEAFEVINAQLEDGGAIGAVHCTHGWYDSPDSDQLDAVLVEVSSPMYRSLTVYPYVKDKGSVKWLEPVKPAKWGHGYITAFSAME